MGASRAQRSRRCTRTSRAAPAVRLWLEHWVARAPPFPRHSQNAARDGGLRGRSRRRQPQPPSLSGWRFLTKRMLRSIRHLSLRRRNWMRPRRARQHRPPHSASQPRRPRPLQHRRDRRVRRRPRLPLQRRHRYLQTMRWSLPHVRSTKLFRCSPPRRLVLPLNCATRLNNDRRKSPDRCKPGRPLRTTFADPHGRGRPLMSPGKSRRGHRHPPGSAGSSDERQLCSVRPINARGSASPFL